MVKTPWLENYGDIPHTLDYPEGTMYDALNLIAQKYPDNIAYDFMGKKTKYKTFIKAVRKAASALKNLGIKKDDVITVCMPNCPQTVVILYAINLVGAIACMVHPLSAEKEIEFYVNDSNSVAAVTLDISYSKFEAVRENINLSHIIVARIKDELLPIINIGYTLLNSAKSPKIKDTSVLFWNDFMKLSDEKTDDMVSVNESDDPAVILYSGGTTGTKKGILLSNYNFNALAKQIVATNPMFCVGDKMLAVMPAFHGFGLGVSIHSMLVNGGRCILVPRFTAKSYAKLLKKTKCNFIAGVPTLFEALIRQPSIEKSDLSCLKGVFSGGDTLSVELKKKFDAFLKERNAKVQIREGYGTTECVTASCLTPIHLSKEGSIGQPFPDMFYKIVLPSTDTELEYGKEGEICISGPTVMLGYLNNEEETADVLRKHADGRVWVHTGDLGVMDADGFVYFRGRLKRIIVTSGYNVYPSQLENVIDSHDAVRMSCVIGVPDPIKIRKIKAFVILNEGYKPSLQLKNQIISYCRKYLAKYAMPYDIEFRTELPKTLVGKVDYRQLENEQ